MPYVVFVDWRVPKSNTTNIHVTSCGHYQRHLTITTQNTRWEIVDSLESAMNRANQLYREYDTLGVKRIKCCINKSP